VPLNLITFFYSLTVLFLGKLTINAEIEGTDFDKQKTKRKKTVFFIRQNTLPNT